MTKQTPENYWNYRLMRRQYPNGEIGYSVHEVYYRCGKVSTWTQAAIELSFLDNPEETMQRILRGIKEFPVLDYETGKELPSDDSE